MPDPGFDQQRALRFFRDVGALSAEGLPSGCLPHRLASVGYGSLYELRCASDEEILRVPMYGPVRLARLRAFLGETPRPDPRPLPAWVAEE